MTCPNSPSPQPLPTPPLPLQTTPQCPTSPCRSATRALDLQIGGRGPPPPWRGARASART
eukprot:10182029-Alexandrium_andersonii.AAC.1